MRRGWEDGDLDIVDVDRGIGVMWFLAAILNATECMYSVQRDGL